MDRRRSQTLVMMRVKNEARWIARSLERSWLVASTVVLFDDHSSDETLIAAQRTYHGISGERCLEIIPSPFDGLNEVRDKNLLWERACRYDPRYVLALDGDEMLSREALRSWDKALDALDAAGPGRGFALPFIYLWDSENKKRVDGVYQEIWHGRLFRTGGDVGRFRDRGAHAGFHCGSLPDLVVVADRFSLPIIHFGYIDDRLRQRKYEFYTSIDPGNKTEGEYTHIIGRSNHLTPGPVTCESYEDL